MATEKYRAYALMSDKEIGLPWRVNISLYDTRAEAEDSALRFASKYKDDKNLKVEQTGVHRYYIIPRKEWEKMQYTSVSISDGKTRTWMTHDKERGTVLLFEGIHFEIAG